MAVPKIDVRSNAGAVIAELQSYGKNVKEGALVRSLNRTLTTVRAESSRALQPVVGLPAAQVKKQLRFRRATRMTLTAGLTFSKTRIRLTRYGAKQMADGVHVKGPQYVIAQPTWGAAPYEITLEQLRHAFIVASRGNNPGNALNAWIRAGRERYPIILLLAPSLSDVAVKNAIADAMVGVAQKRFAEVIQQELRFVVLKRKP